MNVKSYCWLPLQRRDYILLQMTVIDIHLSQFHPPVQTFVLERQTTYFLKAEYTIRRLHATYVIQATYFTLQSLHVGYILHHF